MADDAEACGVQCGESTIRAAFEYYQQQYVQGKKWDTKSHVLMWLWGEEAFSHGSQEVFGLIYEKLQRQWQVFRGSQTHLSAGDTFEALKACCPQLRNQRLSGLTMSDVPVLNEVLEKAAKVKLIKAGPSTVAVSKFLHFWNPKLFVIVDDSVMWKCVLAHHWVWKPIERAREATDRLLHHCRKGKDQACDLKTYLAVLMWAGAFLRAHPQVSRCFAEYIHRYEGELPAGVEEYEAAAMEWFLLGLVEIPPDGWRTCESKSG